jgi:chaperonin GroEL (HSP60 family)
VKIAASLDNIVSTDEDEKIGIAIIKQAIQYPIQQIANNAGFN